MQEAGGSYRTTCVLRTFSHKINALLEPLQGHNHSLVGLHNVEQTHGLCNNLPPHAAFGTTGPVFVQVRISFMVVPIPFVTVLWYAQEAFFLKQPELTMSRCADTQRLPLEAGWACIAPPTAGALLGAAMQLPRLFMLPRGSRA